VKRIREERDDEISVAHRFQAACTTGSETGTEQAWWQFTQVLAAQVGHTTSWDSQSATPHSAQSV